MILSHKEAVRKLPDIDGLSLIFYKNLFKPEGGQR